MWIAFSIAATAAQWALQAMGWTDPMIVSVSPGLTAALLLVAGVYQFSPLKRLCLSRCRTPFGFLLGEWRAGTGGAFAMGLRHGLHCLGCCWALMALLFVGGAMNLAWVAALAVAAGVEKLLPRGERLAAALGIALICIGAAKALFAAVGRRLETRAPACPPTVSAAGRSSGAQPPRQVGQRGEQLGHHLARLLVGQPAGLRRRTSAPPGRS